MGTEDRFEWDTLALVVVIGLLGMATTLSWRFYRLYELPMVLWPH